MLKTLKKEWSAKVAVVAFILLTIWWVYLYHSGAKQQFDNYLFAAVYGVVALWGGVWGLVVAKEWGGVKSVMGRAIIFLALGLFAEEFGQIVFSYYNIVAHIEVPYPSLADVGFFGNIPFYILGISLLAVAAGVGIGLRKHLNKAWAAILPIGMLVFSYFMFLHGYQFDWSSPVKVFLDFGYPLGQALYISIAVLTFIFSTRVLGGIMRPVIFFIIFCFLAQYLADFNFLFQSSRNTWINGGYGDYLYLVAYFFMTLGILQFKTVLRNLRSK